MDGAGPQTGAVMSLPFDTYSGIWLDHHLTGCLALLVVSSAAIATISASNTSRHMRHIQKPLHLV